MHLRGHYAPTHAALGHWREHGGPGHIVCTASTSGLLGNFGQSNYGAAKAGIAAFAHDRRAGVGPDGRDLQRDRAGRPHPDDRGGVRARSSAATEGFDFWHPDNVAPLVAYLVSDASAHISGKVFGVQGNAVELYRPWTSAAAIENEGGRWDPEVLAGRIDVLFAEADIEPAPSSAWPGSATR